MFTITAHQKLSENISQIDVLAPDIARRAGPGQFVMLRVSDRGERIPLTIAGTDLAAGTIRLIFQQIGKTTTLLGTLKTGDSIPDIVGPLGCATHIEKLGTVVAIGGGVGVAEILPVARAFKAAGNRVIGIIGARNKDLIILEPQMKEACDQLIVMTDDGSNGNKGFVSKALAGLIENKEEINIVYAIGPVPMMRVVAELTRPHGIKTVVSLNPIMVDGTGMCGACRVSVGGTTKFACVEGPEFDGHLVDWKELTARLASFKDKEAVSLEHYKQECACKKK